MTPGGAGAPGAPPVAPSAPRFQGSTTFQHFTPHQGFYQPAGPLIRSASPGGTVAPPNAPAPPTATVQPTVVTSQPSTKGNQPTSVREGEFSPSQKDPGSPVKPTPQPPPSAAPTGVPTGVPTGAPTAPTFQPGYPYGPYAYAAAAAAAAGAPPPPFYPPAPPPPAPAPFYGHPGVPHHPYTPQPFGFDPRGYPIYPSPFTPQYGSYYVAPALSYQPTSTATTAASTTSTPSAGSQVALPHPPPPGGYFYGGAYTYPYSAAAAAAGRFVAPTLLTLQPQPAAVPTVYPTYPPPQPQPGAQQLTPESAPAPAAKNSQAGPQVVGKGSNSSDNNNPEIIAEVQITPKPNLKNSSEIEMKEKSSLRDYRKPTKPKQVAPATPSQVPNSTKSSNAADYARALSGGEISITAVIGPKNTHPAPPKQQPPIVSMFPVPSFSKPPPMMSKPPVLTPEIVLPRKPLPPTLTPEIVLPKKPVPPAALMANSMSKSNGVHDLPVLHIPEYTPFHKKKNRLPTVPLSSGSPGHPGMPNGLLQLSTSLQQKGSTKVTPKDQNARVALSKIGLIETSPITVSMAKSAASAVKVNRVSLFLEYNTYQKVSFCNLISGQIIEAVPQE